MAIQRRETKTGKIRWVARWRDKGGREHSRSFDTKREAKQHLAETERRRTMGTPDVTTVRTVRDVYEGWMTARALREATNKQYSYTLNSLLPPLASIPVRELTPGDVTGWVHDLRTCRHWLSRSDTGLAEKTIHTALSNLSSAMLWGIDQGYLDRNPVRMRALPVAVEPEDMPTRGEIEDVIQLIRRGGALYKRPECEELSKQRPNPLSADMLETAALTGMRVSEVAGLAVGEVDLEAGVIRVRRQLSRKAPRKRVELKTRQSRRDIPISDALAPLLRRRVAERDAGELVFVSRAGAPVSIERVGAVVKVAADHAGASRVHFHAVRHHFASHLLTAGVPVQDAAAVLGHSVQTMLATYTHVMEGSLDRVRAGMSAGRGIIAGSPVLEAVPDVG